MVRSGVSWQIVAGLSARQGRYKTTDSIRGSLNNLIITITADIYDVFRFGEVTNSTHENNTMIFSEDNPLMHKAVCGAEISKSLSLMPGKKTAVLPQEQGIPALLSFHGRGFLPPDFLPGTEILFPPCN